MLRFQTSTLVTVFLTKAIKIGIIHPLDALASYFHQTTKTFELIDEHF